MVNINQFIEKEKEKICMICRPKFIAAVKNGREKDYYEEIKQAARVNPLYEDMLNEVEAWIK